MDKEYILVKKWYDTKKKELHDKIGEIIVFDDEKRAKYIKGLGIVKERIKAEPKEETEKKVEAPKEVETKKTVRKTGRRINKLNK